MFRSSIFAAVCVLAVTCFAVVQPAHAETKADNIQELVKIMKMDSIIDGIGPAMTQSIQANLKQQGVQLSAGKQEKLVLAVQKVMKNNLGSLMDQLVLLMDRTYTEQEVKDILAFYKTPTGQKAISAMPTIMNESQVIAGKWVQTIAPQFEQEIAGILQ